MFSFYIGKMKVYIWFSFFAIISLFLVLSQNEWGVWCISAGILHETGHLISYIIKGYPPKELHFEYSGIRLIPRRQIFHRKEDFIFLISGSLVNFICFFALKNFLLIPSLFHLVLGIFNLLPIMPLDGSRILGAIVSVFFGEYTAQIVCAWVSLIVGLCVLVFGIYVLIDSKINLSLCILAGYILICLAVKIYNLLKKRTPNVKS